MDDRVLTAEKTTSFLADIARPDAPGPKPSNSMPVSSPRRPKGIDLFAGAGGFSLGAIEAGIDIVGALEIQKNAALTYEANIRNADGTRVDLIQDDILDIAPQSAMERWGIGAGEIDIVMGGPPCQGFSSHRINDAGVDDPRNKLLGRYFEYVEAIRPRVFIVENVPGLLWDRHKAYLKAFYKRGEEADYDVRPAETINARDFGVPQNRRRVFILGIDKRRPLDLIWPPTSTYVSPATVEPERQGRQSWRTAEDVFDPAAPDDPNDVHMQHSAALVELFKNTPHNGGSRSQSGRVLECHKNYNGHSDVYGRIDPKRPGPTMTTACINPSKGRFVHPTEDHGITLRQAARLQTFPETFIFQGGLMSGGEQIGNAVPMVLAVALLKPFVHTLAATEATVSD